MKRFLSFVLAAVLATTTLVAVAQQGKPAGKGKMDGASSVEMLNTQAKLNMTPPQKKKLAVAMEAMQSKFSKQIEGLKSADGKPDFSKMGPIFQQMKTEGEAMLKKNLTADQYKKFLAYEAAQKSKFSQGKKG